MFDQNTNDVHEGLGKRIFKMRLAALVLLTCGMTQLIYGVDGVAVTISYRSVDGPRNMWKDVVPEREVSYRTWGKLVKYDIVNNEVVNCDTLSHSVSNIPALNFMGTKVAWFRKNAEVVEGNQLVGDGKTCYLSVINLDGTGFRDLLEVGCAGKTPQIDWPYVDGGEWIYYEEVDEAHNAFHGTGRIFRVNATDPSQHELVNDYLPTKHERTFFHRWCMSADGRYAAAFLFDLGDVSNWANSLAHCFPPPDGDPTKCTEKPVTHRGCNPALSPSGKYLLHLQDAGHEGLFLERWNHQKQEMVSMEHWSGPNGSMTHSEMFQWMGDTTRMKAAEWNRSSVNSDKWFLTEYSINGNKAHPDQGSNMTLINWVDEVVIQPSNNPVMEWGKDDGTVHYCAQSGDFRVTPPAGAEEKIETANGRWIGFDELDSYVFDDKFWDGVIEVSAPRLTRKPSVAAVPRRQVGPRGVTFSLGNGRTTRVDIRGRMISTTHFREGSLGR